MKRPISPTILNELLNETKSSAKKTTLRLMLAMQRMGFPQEKIDAIEQDYQNAIKIKETPKELPKDEIDPNKIF